MKKTEFPLRKTFEQDFLSEKGRKLFTLRYQQATLKEYHEFFALSDLERANEILSIIRPQFPLTAFEKVIRFVFPNFRGAVERSLDIQILMKNVIANRLRTYESIYEGINIGDQKKEQKGLFSSNLSLVCQKYCISPVELFENFTIEQYIWMVDGIIYQGNMMDDEGRLKNQIALTDKEEVKKRAEETRRAFEEYEKTQAPNA